MRGTHLEPPIQPLPQKAPEIEEADHVLTRQELNFCRDWDSTRGMFSIAWWEFSLLRFVPTSLHPFVTCLSLHPERHCRLPQLLGRAVCSFMAPLDNALWGLLPEYHSSWAFGIALVLLPKISVWT